MLSMLVKKTGTQKLGRWKIMTLSGIKPERDHDLSVSAVYVCVCVALLLCVRGHAIKEREKGVRRGCLKTCFGS